jgi:hypothetical protein
MPKLAIEDDLEATTAEVQTYRDQAPMDIAAWRDRIRGYAAAGRKPVVWGAGSKCVAMFKTCGIGPEVECVADINPHKAGKFLPGTGHLVVLPEQLREYRPDVVVTMNPVYIDEIRQRLASLGVTANVVGA